MVFDDTNNIDPFSPEQEDIDPFASSAGGTRGTAQPMNPSVAARTATLAAVADTDLSEEGGRVWEAIRSRTNDYRTRLETLGDKDIRAAAAQQEQADRLTALEDVLRQGVDTQTPEETQGAIRAYQNVLTQDNAAAEAYALERRAFNRIQELAAAGDVTQARILLSNMEGGALDRTRDNAIKQAILANAMEKAQVDVKDQSAVASVINFGIGLLSPFGSVSNTGAVDTDSVVKRWYDNVFSGQRVVSEADALHSMSVEDFANYVTEDLVRNLNQNSTFLGYKNNNEYLKLLDQLVDTPSALETNAWNALDWGTIGFGKVAAAPFKKALGMTGDMVRMGARREAVERVAEASLARAQDATSTAARAMPDEELVEGLSVRATSQTPPELAVSLGSETDVALSRARALLDSRPELVETARLEGAELEKATNVIVERLARDFGREVKDVDVGVKPLSLGRSVNQVSFTLGKREGGGYATEGMANRAQVQLGLKGNVIEDDSGQWFIRTTQDMPETGFFINPLKVKRTGVWANVLSSRNVGDLELADAAQVAGNKRAAILQTVVKPYEKVFSSLKGNEKVSLDAVIARGGNEKRWYNAQELETLYDQAFQRKPTNREISAYRAYQEINDIEFLLRNEDAYISKTAKGMRSASFALPGRDGLDRVNALIDRELTSPINTRIYDASTGRHLDSLSDPDRAYYRSKGYVLVNTETPETLADGTKIRSFLVKGSDLTEDNLRLDQISYSSGGHRMYRGKYFVKQTSRGVQPDTGAEYLDSPNVFIVAETRAEALAWTKRMEAARIAANNNAGLDEIDEILGSFPNMPSAKKFLDMLDDGRIARNEKIDVYYDREMPDEYLGDSSIAKYFDPEEDGLNGFLRTTGRMYTGRKGEHLEDYMGNLAPTLDAYETINRSLQNIAALTSFGDYKLTSIERWMRTFSREIDLAGFDEGSSMLDVFMNAPLRTGGNDLQRRAHQSAEAQRAVIKRALGWKTPQDLAFERLHRNVSDWIAGDYVDGIVPEFRKGVSNWYRDTNPVSALRGFAFDLKLGLMNVAQLPLQLGTAVAATTMSPKAGMHGWAMIQPIRYMQGARHLGREAFESRLDELVKRNVHTIGGFDDPKDFKEFMRVTTGSGFIDVGNTHGLLDYYGTHATMDGFKKGVQTVREHGRFFFYEAERWNRIVASRIAWDETKEAGMKIGTTEFSKRWAGRAEEYAMNMSSESQAYWQRGVMSVPTQFWSYSARVIEALTVGNFTRQQKRRLLIGQTLLWGSAGTPITVAGMGLYKSITGNQPRFQDGEGNNTGAGEQIAATFDRGLIDSALYHWAGIDARVGDRLGTGKWLQDTVMDLFGKSAYGTTSVADFVGGATANIIFGQAIADTIVPVFKYAAAESGDDSMPLTRSAVERMIKNVSGASNLMKAYTVYRYGTYMSNSGSTQVNDLPPQMALMTAFGIQPGQLAEINVLMSQTKKRSKAIDEAATVIRNYRVRMLNEPDQVESLAEEINAFTRLLPEEIRTEALKRAHRRVDPSLYSGLVRRKEEREANGQTN